MQVKILFFVVIALAIISVIKSYGSQCSSKRILNSDYSLMYDTYEDHKEAYHHISSCASLHTRDNYACCYIRAKFRNRAADKKYTHRGCIETYGEDWGNIKNYISYIEGNITKDDNIDKVDVEIDCNSKFIKLTALVLFAFLL